MKMRMVIVCLGLAVIACGCGSSEVKTAGFLSDYSKLQRESDSSMRYINDKVAATYSSFIVDPVQTRLYSNSKAKGELTDEQIKDLTSYMRTKIAEAVAAAGCKVVYQPADGVARIRVALTNIEKTDAINMLPQASLLGAGVGGASMEAELVDSVTGQQIAAVLQSRSGSRVPFSNLGDWTAAKGVMDEWAKNFQKKLETMHGK
ncbi:MAG: DUF3313 domain-containing protein [Planctomycetales bacterium]|nr:DUF3313 domain-containing protein [Planctomycetales bacterium]